MRAALVVLGVAACGGAHVKRGYPEPRAEEIQAWLTGVRQRVSSLNAVTRSDVRIGKQRAKVEVDILAAWGGKLRFMAMQPQGGMAADLASDGVGYCFLDANRSPNGCGDCGPATPANVGRIVRIVMPPDDVVTFLLGSTPLIAGATAKVSWEEDGGHEVLTLVSADRVQRVVLDGVQHRWDVLESELKDRQGNLVWRVRHKDYHPVGGVRMPGKSFFEQPSDNVLIEWKEQKLNEPLRPEQFKLALPPGLPPC